MVKHIKFRFDTSLSTDSQKSGNKGMTPQQEYWLNRFLRDYSGKIFWIFILFFVFLFGVIYFASINGNTSVSTGNNININFSN